MPTDHDTTPAHGNGDGDNDAAERDQLTVPADADGMRLDKFLADFGAELSRSAATRLIKDGGVTVDGETLKKPSETVVAGQVVSYVPPAPPPSELVPEDIPLDILYEDDDVVAINKPPGMVTHPATLHMSGTLANALAFRYAQLSDLHHDPTRVGIVHRLDRDTSGVILAARDEWVHFRIGRQFEKREIEKCYLAMVHGHPHDDEFVVDAPIGRHPKHREMQTIRQDGRAALTVFRVLHRLTSPVGPLAWVECRPKTGRTHQIRVHMKHAGFPLLADPMYTNNREVPLWSRFGDDRPEGANPDEPVLRRHALHAWWIEFFHPRRVERLRIEAPLPDDLARLLAAVRAWTATHR
ncbi:MAG: RluA family pseudouridine synthase [Planctomycetota bacterium]